MEIDRADLVWRLLGAATKMFLAESDPILVCCLASSALEHAELLASEENRTTMKAHILMTFPAMSEREFRRLKNKNWTMIKHSHNVQGEAFDIAHEFADFEDSSNDAVLFAGWYDFQKSGRPLPVEAQALQVWYYNLYPNSVDPKKRFKVIHPRFENLPNLPRHEQKTALRLAVAEARNDAKVMDHPNTDARPLLV